MVVQVSPPCSQKPDTEDHFARISPLQFSFFKIPFNIIPAITPRILTDLFHSGNTIIEFVLCATYQADQPPVINPTFQSVTKTSPTNKQNPH